jgi:hypothetical protein
VRAGREEALDIFRKWLSEGTLLECTLSFPEVGNVGGPDRFDGTLIVFFRVGEVGEADFISLTEILEQSR